MLPAALPLAARAFAQPSGQNAPSPVAAPPPLVLLHGLLASSRHWQTVSAELADLRPVFAVDLRNHGRSPRAATMTFDVMVDDLLAWLDARQLPVIDLLGHSMGGKLAMAFACRHPERVRRLVVVDIAPRAYRTPTHVPEFRAMHELRLDSLRSRAEAEMRLEGRVADVGMRRFLAGNLERDDATGAWRWHFDLLALTAALPSLKGSPLAAHDRFPGRTLFLAGERSPYVTPEDLPLIRAHFPCADVLRLPRSGHNPHLESRADFLSGLETFLNDPAPVS